jgi:cell division initiation protein
MITPAEIQSTKFTKGVRGYKEDEVDSFLDLLTLDMDKLIQENRILRENIEKLSREIERYRGTENTIFDTLESAKALMGDISSSAEKRAEIVLKNAELDADRIRREARESVDVITEEAREMAARWEQFKSRFKALLQTEIDRFDAIGLEPIEQNRLGFFSDDPLRMDAPVRTQAHTAPASSPQNPASGAGLTDTIKTNKRNGL